MVQAPKLNVWLYGVHVATLDQPKPLRYRLTFTPEALSNFGHTVNILTLAFPIGEQVKDTQYSDRPVGFFLDGLLPEGRVRSELASRLRVASNEYIPLLSSVGFECAGAIQFLKDGELPTDGRLMRLTKEQVIELVQDAPTYPEGHEPQASLAGVQEKVLLTKTVDGWAWPERGEISTHIIKPEPQFGAALDNIVSAEHWALTVARSCGLAAAETKLERFGERLALVVTRFDRTSDGSRIHQEDFCQALGLNPADKYETTVMAKPYRLKRIANLLAPASGHPAQMRETLLKQVAFNTMIGNGDSHSKNFSILIHRHGEATLAPLYDVAPTAFMNARFRQSGHVINGIRDLNYINAESVVEEGVSWGIPRRRANAVVAELSQRFWESVNSVVLPDELQFLLPNLKGRWTDARWSSISAS